MSAIYKKELKSYFNTGIGWLFLAATLCLVGLFPAIFLYMSRSPHLAGFFWHFFPICPSFSTLQDFSGIFPYMIHFLSATHKFETIFPFFSSNPPSFFCNTG